MATILENTQIIQENVNEMKERLNLPSSTPLAEVTNRTDSVYKYLDTIPAGTSTCPGMAKTFVQVPTTLKFASNDASYAFFNLSNLTEYPKIDYSGLTKIDYMFSGTKCSDIHDFVIPETVTSAKYLYQGYKFPAGVYNYRLPNITTLNDLFTGVTMADYANTTFNIHIGPNCKTATSFFSNENTSSSAARKCPGYINLTADEPVLITMTGAFKGIKSLKSLICDDNIKPTSLSQICHKNSYQGANIDYFEVNLDECTSMSEMFGSYTPRTVKFKGESRKVTSMYYLLYTGNTNSDSLNRTTKIEGQLYGDSVTNLTSAFYYQKQLTDFTGIKNIGMAYTEPTEGYSKYTFSLSSCTLLTHESLVAIIDNLYDLNISYGVYDAEGNPGEGVLYKQKLVLGEANLAKLTEEEIAVATNKGWIVS